MSVSTRESLSGSSRPGGGLQSAFYDSKFLSSLAGFALGPFVTIFSLHRPLSPRHPHAGTDVDFLAAALQQLRDSGFTFVSLDEVIRAGLGEVRLPPRAVCFTVDDGYADQAEHLLPVLNAHEAKATFFVITDFVDGKEWPWDEKITYVLEHSKVAEVRGLGDFFAKDTLALVSEAEKRAARRYLQTQGKELDGERIPALLQRLSEVCGVHIPEQPPAGYEAMTWEQARELEKAGTIFAPHSCNHYITSRVSPAEAQRQFRGSWARVSEELRAPDQIYCYPTGRPQDFTPEHERMLAAAGYRGAVSFVSRPLRLSKFRDEQFRLPRIGFPDEVSLVMRYAGWVEAFRSLSA